MSNFYEFSFRILLLLGFEVVWPRHPQKGLRDFFFSKITSVGSNERDEVCLEILTTVSFSSCKRNLIKIFQMEAMIALNTKMALIFSWDLLNGQKELSKKAKILRNFRHKSRSILMLQKIGKNRKFAPKLIFFNKIYFRKFKWFLTLKIDFENQILALFDGYFWPFNKSHEKSNAIFVISAIQDTIASIWNVFIKFSWHDEKLLYARHHNPLLIWNRSWL